VRDSYTRLTALTKECASTAACRTYLASLTRRPSRRYPSTPSSGNTCRGRRCRRRPHSSASQAPALAARDEPRVGLGDDGSGVRR
jgi:hypothetical protein